jgi:serine/threonine protein phosphatase PrpC
VGLHIRGNVYEVAWIGDSRAYLWNGRHLLRLTRDHSFVQQLVDSGELRQEMAAQHPYRNILMRCIGSSDESCVIVDSVGGVFYRDDRILLCSDGLTGELADAEIEAAFAAGLGGTGDGGSIAPGCAGTRWVGQCHGACHRRPR